MVTSTFVKDIWHKKTEQTRNRREIPHLDKEYLPKPTLIVKLDSFPLSWGKGEVSFSHHYFSILWWNY